MKLRLSVCAAVASLTLAAAASAQPAGTQPEAAGPIDRDTRTVEALTAAAEAGDPHAMNVLGGRLLYAWGVEQDVEQAVGWFARSSAKGDPVGTYYLGMVYFDGWPGFPADMDRSKALLTRAAEMGEPRAMAWLGDSLRWATFGGEEDHVASKRWLERAANQGSVIGMVWLAAWYDAVEEAEDDEPEAARRWMQKALVAASRPDARLTLDDLYALGLYYQGTNDVASMQWLKKAADRGDPWSMDTLGTTLLNLNQPAEAEKMYRKAAEQHGLPYAYWSLGQFYTREGVEPDYGKAAAAYKRGAALENADARVELGRLYLSGQGVDEDVDEAVRLFKAAVEQESGEAARELADLYETGTGVEQDPAKARELREKADEWAPEEEDWDEEGVGVEM